MIPRIRAISLALLAISVVLISVSDAHAEVPVKFIPANHIGWDVNKTTKGNLCTVVSGNECQIGTESSESGGFKYPQSVASAPEGDIYVTDKGNARVQKFTATGEFVLMFGEEVNETKDNTPSATEAEKNVCTEEEIKNTAVKCKSGHEGSTVGSISDPQSVAVEPIGGNIYVQDYANWRVDEYTPDGQFVLMIGKEVNETKDNTPGATEAEKNVCSEEEITSSAVKCKAGMQNAAGSVEKGSFDFEQYQGNLLAIGSAPERLLYIGDRGRVQEFDAKGEWKGEIKMNGAVTALAIDSQSNTAYVVYSEEPVVHEFDTTTDNELSHPIEIGSEFAIRGIAVDSSGHLAITAASAGNGKSRPFGELYEASSGHFVTKFTIPDPLSAPNTKGLTFNNKGELYLALENHELINYIAVPVAELITGANMCTAGPVKETSDTYNCTLDGEVDPYNVPGTLAWFEWGKSCTLGANTQKESIATVDVLVSVSTTLKELRPNETVCYRLAGEDENVLSPEQLTAANTASFTTLAVPPVMVGEPSSSFITSSSAVLYGELNPENSLTEYYFEYAPGSKAGETLAACHDAKGGACPGVAVTDGAESAVYGRTGATFEATGLQPGTTYRYRLKAFVLVGTATGQSLSGEEGSITTASAPQPEAFTGSVNTVTTSSAVVHGAVNANGQQATYTFELGVYRGAATTYSVVFSGSTNASTAVEQEQDILTDLQPATEYAYRIAIHSGYGTGIGAPAIFRTEPVAAGLPVSIAPIQLAVPKITFPTPGFVACKRGYVRNKRGLCVKAKANGKGSVSKRTVKKKKIHRTSKRR